MKPWMWFAMLLLQAGSPTASPPPASPPGPPPASTASSARALSNAEQGQLNCQSYGIAGAMLAVDRDEGMTQAAAIADLRENFARLDVSQPQDLQARDYVLRILESEARSVYQRTQLKPKTVLYALPMACMGNMTGKVDGKHIGLFLDGYARSCQDEQTPPLPSPAIQVRDEASVRLQHCIEHIAPKMFEP